MRMSSLKKKEEVEEENEFRDREKSSRNVLQWWVPRRGNGENISP